MANNEISTSSQNHSNRHSALQKLAELHLREKDMIRTVEVVIICGKRSVVEKFSCKNKKKKK